MLHTHRRWMMMSLSVAGLSNGAGVVDNGFRVRLFIFLKADVADVNLLECDLIGEFKTTVYSAG